MPADLELYAQSSKSIPTTLSWQPLKGNYIGWISPLDIDGVTIAGLQLRMIASVHLPNEAVIVQLEHHQVRGKCEQLVRVEWRPLSGHNNKGRGPQEWRFKQITGTHVHRFAMNWDPTK